MIPEAIMGVLKPVFVAVVLGIGAWVLNIDARVDQHDTQIVVTEKEFKAINEKLDAQLRMIETIQTDIKGMSRGSALSENDRQQLAYVVDAVKRMNCMLAGGPSKRPKPPACVGIF